MFHEGTTAKRNDSTRSHARRGVAEELDESAKQIEEPSFSRMQQKDRLQS
jgi:hypothetical protein